MLAIPLKLGERVRGVRLDALVLPTHFEKLKVIKWERQLVEMILPHLTLKISQFYKT